MVLLPTARMTRPEVRCHLSRVSAGHGSLGKRESGRHRAGAGTHAKDPDVTGMLKHSPKWAFMCFKIFTLHYGKGREDLL